MTELGSNSAALDIDQSIVLVGMMGAGKTTVGRRLAPRLGLDFIDADEEIERAAGMKVSDLFKAHGEESFRRGEAQVIERLLDGPPIVLATGGGAMVNDGTREIISKKSVSVWISSDIDTLLVRATRRGTRPLLKTGDPRKTLLRLLDERQDFYSQATIRVDSRPGPHSNTVTAIIEALTPYFTANSEPQEITS